MYTVLPLHGRIGHRKRWRKLCAQNKIHDKEVQKTMEKTKQPGSYEDFKKYTVEEISSILGLGKTKTRELLDSKLLPVTKIGRDYFTSKQCLQDFLKNNIGNELYF